MDKTMSLTKATSPCWYWSKGLHDAIIISKRMQYFDDYYKSHDRYYNCLELTIDASNALFDSSVSCIKFFNCKEVDPELSIEGKYWVSDEVFMSGNMFTLKIKIISICRQESTYEITFENCHVLRKKCQGDGSLDPDQHCAYRGDDSFHIDRSFPCCFLPIKTFSVRGYVGLLKIYCLGQKVNRPLDIRTSYIPNSLSTSRESSL